jgi:hypothetical protein
MTRVKLIAASLAEISLPSPRPLRGAIMRRREAGRGAVSLRAGHARPALGTASGSPRGPARSCDRQISTARGAEMRNPNGTKDRGGTLTSKAGPAPDNTATGAPRGARRGPARDRGAIGLRFSAPTPLKTRTPMRRTCLDGERGVFIPPLEGGEPGCRDRRVGWGAPTPRPPMASSDLPTR